MNLLTLPETAALLRVSLSTLRDLARHDALPVIRVSARQARAADRRQEAALVAYVQTGTVKGAAHRLGITERAIRKRLADYCSAHGHKSVVQAAYWLGRPESEDHFGTSV